MQGGRSVGYWLLPVAVIVTIAAATITLALRPSHGHSAHVSETLASRKAAADAPKPAPTPTLYETLRAADLLARAGALPAPAPAPTQVPLIEVLQAADALAKAGFLPPVPTEVPLIEVLQAADALVKAGFLPPPPAPTQVPLIDVLHAAVALAQAGALPPPDAPPLNDSPPLVVSVAAATATPAPPPAAGGWYDDAYIGQVRDLVNAQRAQHGLVPVTMEPRLTNAAASYARTLSDYNWFSHVGPDGSTLVSRVEAAGFPFNVQIGEVLAWGTQSWLAPGLVQAWMNSPAHREEILDPAYTRAGVSCYFTLAQGVTVHCVMDFAG